MQMIALLEHEDFTRSSRNSIGTDKTQKFRVIE
jgi:hypothetical protein